jgi:hypothetical protein
MGALLLASCFKKSVHFAASSISFPFVIFDGHRTDQKMTFHCQLARTGRSTFEGLFPLEVRFSLGGGFEDIALLHPSNRGLPERDGECARE